MASDVARHRAASQTHRSPSTRRRSRTSSTRIWAGASARGDATSRRSGCACSTSSASASRRRTRSNAFEHVMEALPAAPPVPRHPRGRRRRTLHGVEASISAHCWRAGSGGRHVCSEEVRAARGAGRKSGELASAVLALLVPELPVTAWLIGEPDLDAALVARDRSRPPTACSSIQRDAADIAATFRAALRRAARARHRDVRPRVVPARHLARARRAVLRRRRRRCANWRGCNRSRSRRGRRASVERRRCCSPAGSCRGLDCRSPTSTQRDRGIEATLYDGTRGVRLRVIACERRRAAARARCASARRMPQFLVQPHEESGHMHVREEWAGGSSRAARSRSAPADDAAIFARGAGRRR